MTGAGIGIGSSFGAAEPVNTGTGAAYPVATGGAGAGAALRYALTGTTGATRDAGANDGGDAGALTGAGWIATLAGFAAAIAAIERGFANGITLGGGFVDFGGRVSGAGSGPRRTGVVNATGATRLTSTDVFSPPSSGGARRTMLGIERTGSPLRGL